MLRESGGLGQGMRAKAAGGSDDFLRQQREARELAEKTREIEAAIRALRTSELPVLTREDLEFLIAECKR